MPNPNHDGPIIPLISPKLRLLAHALDIPTPLLRDNKIFERSSAAIMAPHNVRMNCVLPGLMMTPMVTRMAEKYAGGDLDGFIATRNGQVPMGKMGTAHDVANAVLFLVADESHYITGTEIIVDGGVTATIPQ